MATAKDNLGQKAKQERQRELIDKVINWAETLEEIEIQAPSVILELRELLGLSQTKLAHELGITSPTLSKFEKAGESKRAIIIKISRFALKNRFLGKDAKL